jgi:hypothetical protein
MAHDRGCEITVIQPRMVTIERKERNNILLVQQTTKVPACCGVNLLASLSHAPSAFAFSLSELREAHICQLGDICTNALGICHETLKLAKGELEQYTRANVYCFHITTRW